METPAAPEISTRFKVPHLVLLAAASLSMAFGVECLGLIVQWLSQANTAVYSLGDTAVFVLQVGSGVLGLSAALAGAAPAVLVEGHRLFRCMLAGAHLLVAWSTQAVGYLAFLPFGAEFTAALCVSSLVGLLGTFAGLAVWDASVRSVMGLATDATSGRYKASHIEPTTNANAPTTIVPMLNPSHPQRLRRTHMADASMLAKTNPNTSDSTGTPSGFTFTEITVDGCSECKSK